MTFPKKLLGPGEVVYVDSRPHWSLLVRPGVVVLVAVAGATATVVLWSAAPIVVGWVLLAIVGLAILHFVGRWISWRARSFVVTSQRIVYRSGVARRTGREIPISRVQDVTYDQTILERIVGAGRLTVESAGRAGREPFPDIRRPAEVQSLINQIQSGTAGRGDSYPPDYPGGSPVTPPVPFPAVGPAARTGPAPVPATPPPPSERPQRDLAPGDLAPLEPPPREPPVPVAEQLERLAALHRRGVLTDAEYESKRREVLDLP